MNKTIFILVTLCLALSLPAAVVHNDIVPVFPEADQPGIEGAVINGAIHFLQGKSHADLILSEYEKTGISPLDYAKALEYTGKAIADLENSLDDYSQAVTGGKEAGYVDSMILKFKDFDYDSFASENRLNSDIMVSVKAYFSAGNIVGAYQQNVDNINDVLFTLIQIKEKLAAGQSPDISLIWQLLGEFCETALFGNYCTRTAHAVFAQ